MKTFDPDQETQFQKIDRIIDLNIADYNSECLPGFELTKQEVLEYLQQKLYDKIKSDYRLNH